MGAFWTTPVTSAAAGPWISLVANLASDWSDAAAEGWGTDVLSYRLHGDSTVEIRGGVAIASGDTGAGKTFLTLPAAALPAASTVWGVTNGWTGGGSTSIASGFAINGSSGNTSLDVGTPPLDVGDAHLLDGLRYPV